MTVSSFIDESGKFNDHGVISMGCVAAFAEQMADFVQEWGRVLRFNGLKALHIAEVLNYNKPISEKNDRRGIKERNDDLLPFVKCIRKYLQVAAGMAVDTVAFKRLPPHFFQVFGTDPAYLAFMRIMLLVTEFTPEEDKISMICDEDEGTAISFYKLYRKLKQEWPGARDKMAGVSFVDDRFVFGVQASDLVAAMFRLDAKRRLEGISHDYEPLFNSLTAPPDMNSEKLWFCGVATADKETLIRTAEDTIADLKRRKLIA